MEQIEEILCELELTNIEQKILLQQPVWFGNGGGREEAFLGESGYIAVCDIRLSDNSYSAWGP